MVLIVYRSDGHEKLTRQGLSYYAIFNNRTRLVTIMNVLCAVMRQAVPVKSLVIGGGGVDLADLTMSALFFCQRHGDCRVGRRISLGPYVAVAGWPHRDGRDALVHDPDSGGMGACTQEGHTSTACRRLVRDGKPGDTGGNRAKSGGGGLP